MGYITIEHGMSTRKHGGLIWANEWEKVESINLDALDHDLIVIRHWNDGIVWGIIPSHGLISVIFRLVNHKKNQRDIRFTLWL